MGHSNDEFNVRGKPRVWQNHTVDPPIPRKDLSDIYRLAITFFAEKM